MNNNNKEKKLRPPSIIEKKRKKQRIKKEKKIGKLVSCSRDHKSEPATEAQARQNQVSVMNRMRSTARLTVVHHPILATLLTASARGQ